MDIVNLPEERDEAEGIVVSDEPTEETVETPPEGADEEKSDTEQSGDDEAPARI